MPIETIPNTNLRYYLIAFDADGNERQDDPDGLMSAQVIDILTTEPISDVFIFSHGWLGDIPAAKEQYEQWVKAMANQTQDIERIQKKRSEFRYLLIGLHWPSKPWGDEELRLSNISFKKDDSSSRNYVKNLVDSYAKRIADTEVSRQALQTIFRAANENLTPERLPRSVREAYEILDKESGLSHDGIAAAPGSDSEALHPDAVYDQVIFEAPEQRGSIFKGILTPLQYLSFWKMKDRARRFGETSGFQLLHRLQKESTSNDVRFHLMGHSFGSIVVSAMLSGLDKKGILVRPINSLTLVQGALSLWSYCPSIPVLSSGKPGYFHNIIANKKVAGSIITTQSKFDLACGKLYPLGAGIARQVAFDPKEPPKYGALATFGIQGLKDISESKVMLQINESYQFEPGKIYNLNSDQFIFKANQSGDAHNNINNPGVAHTIWEAAMA
ncbi:hypothetical protein H1Q63_03470 [Desmonostoc muscorum CCALA 125]|nr:hypothetical protein [Desmonostoc muscorum CCALA 125]